VIKFGWDLVLLCDISDQLNDQLQGRLKLISGIYGAVSGLKKS
jgi:hypothetical protein